MKRFLLLLTAIFSILTAAAQSENSIIIDQNSLRAVQSDALTGVNIAPIGEDSSRRPCARIKVRINRMNREEIDQIALKIVTNNELRKCKTADYDNGLIIEMTAKSATRFYFNHPEFGESNEVTLNLEPNKEYYMEASLNQTYSIVVNSNVEGADVYLDNNFKGRTDSNFSLTVKEVLVGPHTLKVTYGGIEHEQNIDVNSSNISFRQMVNTKASEPQFVVFVVEPSSAVVLIDNQPYSLQDGAMQVVLDCGTYNYTVTAAGYHPQSGTFSVAGEKVEKRISLTADTATVSLTAPDNAEIWVNGSKRGVGSWQGTLTCGTYIFEARKDGHESGKLSRQITAGGTTQRYELPAPTPIVGSLLVSGVPITADVALDGKAVGTIPLKLSDVLIGKHTLTVSKSGYQTDKQTITITKGETAVVNVSLVKQTASTPTPKPATTTSTPTPKPAVKKSYAIGDLVTVDGVQGIVFQITPQVKIVSVAEGRAKWSTGHWSSKPIDRGSGRNNLNMIQKASTSWGKMYPAFKWCADLGSGWYLPAQAELKAVYNQRAAINNTLKANGMATLGTSRIWTSTGYDSVNAYWVAFSDGWSSHYNRMTTYAVRAVKVIE